MKNTAKRVTLLVLIIGVIVSLRLSGLERYLAFGRLQENKAALEQLVDAHYGMSAAGYILAYIIVTGFSLPGAAVMTLAGGFVFGMVSVVFVNIGATSGAALSFLFSRYLIGEWVQKRYGERLVKFNEGLSRNGHYYLLALRLIPAFPFFLINVFSGLTTIPLWTFVWTTALGIVPGSLVYTFAGTQLGSIRSPGDIFSTNMLVAFLLLALLALTPVILKYIRRAKP